MTCLQGIGQQGTVGIRSVQATKPNRTTGQSNETITNNTASPSTGMGGLEKEQTTDTGVKMIESDKSSYDTQQGQQK